MIENTPTVTLRGQSLFLTPRPADVLIEKGEEGSGIVFRDKSGDIDLSVATLHANTSFIGARYLYVGQPDYKAVRVPEHLLSALFLRGINDVRITAKEKQIPLDGPGIQSFYDSLTPFDTLRQAPSGSHFHVVKAAKFETVYKGIKVSVEAIPSTDLCIQVLTAKHPDLPDLCEKPFTLANVRLDALSFLEARPIARLKNFLKYGLWLGLSKLGHGINESTYLIATPKDGAKEIRRKMQAQYRDDGNEHSAHTAVCDFPGELRAVAPNISGTFILSNTNHLTRIAAIRYFIQQGVLVEKT